MGMTEVIAGIKAALAGAIPVVEPKDQIGPYPLMMVYPRPGLSTPMQHTGRSGSPVYQNRDQAVVEWHTQIPGLDRFIEVATPTLDAMRAALWLGAVSSKFNGSIVVLHSIDTDILGAMAWGSDETLGIRLIVEVTHATSV